MRKEKVEINNMDKETKKEKTNNKTHNKKQLMEYI